MKVLNAKKRILAVIIALSMIMTPVAPIGNLYTGGAVSYAASETPYGGHSVEDKGTLDDYGLYSDGNYSNGQGWAKFNLKDTKKGEFVTFSLDDEFMHTPTRATWGHLTVYVTDENENNFTKLGEANWNDGVVPAYADPDAVYYCGYESDDELRIKCNVSSITSTGRNAIQSDIKNPVTIDNPQTINVSSSDINDGKWFKIEAPIPEDEDSDALHRVKIKWQSTDGFPFIEHYRVGSQEGSLYINDSAQAIRKGESGNFYDFDEYRNVVPENTAYLNVSPGADEYIRISGFDNVFNGSIAISYVDINLEPGEVVDNSKVKALEAAEPLTRAVVDYLNEVYLSDNNELATRIPYTKASDREILKTLAERITKDCNSNMEKAVKISKWVGDYLDYNLYGSAFTMDALGSKEGNCLSYSNLTCDLLRSCGIRAAMVDGWTRNKASEDSTWGDLPYDDGHAWSYAYIDGKWLLFDSLWGKYGIEDPAECAEHVIPDRVDGISVISDEVSGRGAESPAYKDGYFQVLCGKTSSASSGLRYKDTEGDTLFQAFGVGRITASTNNMTHAFYVHEGTFSFRYIESLNGGTSERALPPYGGLFTDGFFEVVTSDERFYAWENGVLANNSVEEFDGKLYYFEQGKAYETILPEDQFDLSGHMIVKTGTVSEIMKPFGLDEYKDKVGDNPGDYVIEYTSSNPDVATVDENGVITTKSEGNVFIDCNVKQRQWDGQVYGGTAFTDAIFLTVKNSLRNIDVDKINTDVPESGTGDNPPDEIEKVTPTISLSNKTTAYTGKSIAIGTAKCSSNADGTVKYTYYKDKSCTTKTTSSNSGASSTGAAPKYVGTYYVKATMAATEKCNAASSNVVTLKINPKKAVISSLTSGTRKLTVKMSTKPSSTGGNTYEIQYKRKGTSTWKTISTTAQSKTIGSLKKGKIYYVRVRAKKSVSGVKYLGAWSVQKTSKKIK